MSGSREETAAHVITEPPAAVSWPALVALTLLAFCVRVLTAGWGGLSCDEANCANIAAASSWLDTFEYIKNDGNAPLYYVFLRLWGTVFGDSDLSLRAFAVLCGTALAPVCYLVLRRRAGEHVAVETAVLASVCAPLVEFGNLVRPYGLLPIFGVVATASMMQLLEAPSRAGKVRYAVLMALTVYLHHWGAMLALGHAAAVAAGLAAGWWRPAPAGQWLQAAAAALLLYSPWFLVLRYQLANDVSPWIVTPPWGMLIFSTPVEALSGYREKPEWWHAVVVVWANLAFWAALLVPVVISFRSGQKGSFRSRPWQWATGSGIAAAMVVSQFRSIWRDRYLTVFSPLLLLLYAAVSRRLTLRLPRRLAVALPVVLWLPVWLPQLLFFHRFPESSAWALMEQLARKVDADEDLIVVSFEAIAPQVDRYLPQDVRVLSYPALERVKAIRWAGIDERIRDPGRLRRLLAAIDDRLERGGDVWLVESYHKYVPFPLRYPIEGLNFNSVEAVRMCQVRAYLEGKAQKQGKDLWAPGREFSVMASRFRLAAGRERRSQVDSRQRRVDDDAFRPGAPGSGTGTASLKAEDR